MENSAPSSLLVSVIDVACRAAMKLKESRKKPFTCLVVRVERGKNTYDIVPVYAPNYEMSVEAARQQAAGWQANSLMFVIVSDGNVTTDAGASDAIIIEALEVDQGVRFQFVRRYTPSGLLSKAKSDEKLTLVKREKEQARPA
jgi:hypothetical protein